MRDVVRCGPNEGLLYLGKDDHDIFLRWLSFHSGEVKVPATVHLWEAVTPQADEMTDHIGHFGIPLDANGDVIPSTVHIGHLYRNVVIDCRTDLEISLTYEWVPRG